MKMRIIMLMIIVILVHTHTYIYIIISRCIPLSHLQVPWQSPLMRPNTWMPCWRSGLAGYKGCLGQGNLKGNDEFECAIRCEGIQMLKTTQRTKPCEHTAALCCSPKQMNHMSF